MTRPDPLVRILTAENERLQDRIAELTRIMAGRALSDGPVAGLSIQQTMIVALIAKRGRVSREVMHAYLRANAFDVTHDSGSVRHQIGAARVRLTEYTITITTLPGWGWQMDDASRRAWARIAASPADLEQIAAGDKVVAS